MFNFFKSKSPVVKVNDRVWMTEEAKFDACLEMQKIKPQVLFLHWFEGTRLALLRFSELKGAPLESVYALKFKEMPLQSCIPVFIEHYPIADREQELFISLQLTQVNILSALNEPLFMIFGGARIIGLMEELGMQPNEEIEHPLISRSIFNTQKKISEKIKFEKQAATQSEWFRQNLPTY